MGIIYIYNYAYPMERRTFVKTLAEVARAFADQLENLQNDIQTLSTEQALWKRVRQEFLLNPGLVHLNCGSVGATPRMVIDAVSACMRQFDMATRCTTALDPGMRWRPGRPSFSMPPRTKSP